MKTRKIAAGILTMALAAATSIPAFAGTFFRGTDDRMYYNGYTKDDGTRAMNEWCWIDRDGDGVEECYYFDQDGWTIPAWKQTPDGYNVNSEGAWTVNEVVQTRGTATVDLTKAASIVGTYASKSWDGQDIITTITDNGDGGVRMTTMVNGNTYSGVYYCSGEKTDRGYVWFMETEDEKDDFIAGVGQINDGSMIRVG